MKKITKIKATLLALLMLLGLIAPVTATAQSDGFFRGGGDSYDNRMSPSTMAAEYQTGASARPCRSAAVF